MKKYLLICTFTNYNYDDDDLTAHTFQVGNFDTLDECYKACEDEVRDQAENNAESYGEEDQQKALIEEFCRCTSKVGEIDDNSFVRPLADRIIFEHWYNGGNYTTQNTFTVIKIA